jgi:hypothetical protein
LPEPVEGNLHPLPEFIEGNTQRIGVSVGFDKLNQRIDYPVASPLPEFIEGNILLRCLSLSKATHPSKVTPNVYAYRRQHPAN